MGDSITAVRGLDGRGNAAPRWPGLALLIRFAFLVALAMTSARQLAAQEASCSFERCGLVVVSRNSMIGAPVDTGPPHEIMWYFVPHVPALETATGPARTEYRRARRLYNASAVVQTVGIPSFLGVFLFTLAEPDKRPWGWKAENRLLGVTVAAQLLEMSFQARGADHLSRAAWLYSRPSEPQRGDPHGCTYDKCALRYRYRTWSTRLLQGRDERTVTASDDLFSHASDSARTHYQSYLALHHDTAWLGPFVLGTFVGGMVASSSSDKRLRGVGVGLFGVGYGLGHLSLQTVGRARRELEIAVWLYNRDLATRSQ